MDIKENIKERIQQIVDCVETDVDLARFSGKHVLSGEQVFSVVEITPSVIRTLRLREGQAAVRDRRLRAIGCHPGSHHGAIVEACKQVLRESGLVELSKRAHLESDIDKHREAVRCLEIIEELSLPDGFSCRPMAIAECRSGLTVRFEQHSECNIPVGWWDKKVCT